MTTSPTAKRYKLPDALGGGEYEGSFEEHLAGVIRLNFNGRAIYVPLDMLTEISPPIPPQPGPGAYLIGDSMALAVRFENDGDPNWLSMPGGWRHWEDLWRDLGGPDVTITRLVPERVETVEPVTLPWQGESAYGTPIRVERERDGEVGIVIGNRDIGMVGAVCTPEGTREFANALLAASRAES